jgi:ADP-ribose pyrophosphatase YjhB (NUDIX family)
VLIVDGRKLLLGKRRVEPSKGQWDVIGGFLEYGESPSAGAAREAKEETGLDVETHDFLGFFMDTYGSEKEATLNMCFVGTVVGGELTPGDDIAELRWFAISDIPKAIAFQNGRDMIDAWLAQLSP